MHARDWVTIWLPGLRLKGRGLDTATPCCAQVDARQQLVEEQRHREQLRADAAATLEQRRQRLAAKLAAEDAQLKQELLDLQVHKQPLHMHSSMPRLSRLACHACGMDCLWELSAT